MASTNPSNVLLSVHTWFTNGNDTSAGVPTFFGNLAANLSSLVINFLQLRRNRAVAWTTPRIALVMAALPDAATMAFADLPQAPRPHAAAQPALHTTPVSPIIE